MPAPMGPPSSAATSVACSSTSVRRKPFGLDTATKRRLDEQRDRNLYGDLNSAERRHLNIAKVFVKLYDPEPSDSPIKGDNSSEVSMSSDAYVSHQDSDNSANDSQSAGPGSSGQNSTLAEGAPAPQLSPLNDINNVSANSSGHSQISSFSFLKLPPTNVNINAVMATKETDYVRNQLPWSSAQIAAAAATSNPSSVEASNSNSAGGVPKPSMSGLNCAPAAIIMPSSPSLSRRRSMQRRLPQDEEDEDESEADDMHDRIVSTAAKLVDERRVRFAVESKPAPSEQQATNKNNVDTSSPQSILRKRPQQFGSALSSPGGGGSSSYNSQLLNRAIPPPSRWDSSPQSSSTSLVGVKKRASQPVYTVEAEMQVDRRMPPLQGMSSTVRNGYARLSTISSDYSTAHGRLVSSSISATAAARRRSAVPTGLNYSPHRRNNYAPYALSPSRVNTRSSRLYSQLTASHGDLSHFYAHRSPRTSSGTVPLNFTTNDASMQHDNRFASDTAALNNSNTIFRAGGFSADDIERFVEPPTLQEHQNGFYDAENRSRNPYAHVRSQLNGIQPPLLPPQFTPSRPEPLDLSSVPAWQPPQPLVPSSTTTNSGLISKATAAVAVAAAAVNFTGQLVQGAVSAAGNDAKYLAGVATQYVVDVAAAASRNDETPARRSLLQSQPLLSNSRHYAADIESSDLDDVPKTTANGRRLPEAAAEVVLRRQQLVNRRRPRRRHHSAEISSSSSLLDAEELEYARPRRGLKQQEKQHEPPPQQLSAPAVQPLQQQLAEAVNAAPLSADSDSLNDEQEGEQDEALNLSLRDYGEKANGGRGRVGVELVDFVAAHGRASGATVSPYAEAQRRSQALACGLTLEPQYSPTLLDSEDDDGQQPRALSFAQTSTKSKKSTFSVPTIPKLTGRVPPQSSSFVSQQSRNNNDLRMLQSFTTIAVPPAASKIVPPSLRVDSTNVFSTKDNSNVVDGSAVRNWDSTRRGSWLPSGAVVTASEAPSTRVSQQVQTDAVQHVDDAQRTDADDSLDERALRRPSPPEVAQPLSGDRTGRTASSSSSALSATTGSTSSTFTSGSSTSLASSSGDQPQSATSQQRSIMQESHRTPPFSPSAVVVTVSKPPVVSSSKSAASGSYFVVLSPPGAANVRNANHQASANERAKVVREPEMPAPAVKPRQSRRGQSLSSRPRQVASEGEANAMTTEPAARKRAEAFSSTSFFAVHNALPAIEEDDDHHVDADHDAVMNDVADDADATLIADVAAENSVQHQSVVGEQVVDYALDTSSIDMNVENEASAITPIRLGAKGGRVGRPRKHLSQSKQLPPPPSPPSLPMVTRQSPTPEPPIRSRLRSQRDRNATGQFASSKKAEKSPEANEESNAVMLQLAFDDVPSKRTRSRSRQQSNLPSASNESRSRTQSPSALPVAAAARKISSSSSSAGFSQHKINKIPVISSSFLDADEPLPSLPDDVPEHDAGENRNEPATNFVSPESSPQAASPVVEAPSPPKRNRGRPLRPRRSASVAAGALMPPSTASPVTVSAPSIAESAPTIIVQGGVSPRRAAAQNSKSRKQANKKHLNLRRHDDAGDADDGDNTGRNSNLSLPINNQSGVGSTGSRQSQRNRKRYGLGPPRHQKNFGIEKRTFHAEVISNVVKIKGTPVRTADGAVIYHLASDSSTERNGGGEAARYPKRKNRGLPPVAGHKYVYGKTPGGKATTLTRLPNAGELATPRLKGETHVQHLLSPTFVISQRSTKQSVDNTRGSSVASAVAASSSSYARNATAPVAADTVKPQQKNRAKTATNDTQRVLAEETAAGSSASNLSHAIEHMPTNEHNMRPRRVPNNASAVAASSRTVQTSRNADEKVVRTSPLPKRAVAEVAAEQQPPAKAAAEQQRPKRRRAVHPVDSPLVVPPAIDAAADANNNAPPYYFGHLVDEAEKAGNNLVPKNAVEFLKQHRITRDAGNAVASGSVGEEFLNNFTAEVGPKTLEVGCPLRRVMTGVRALLFHKANIGDGKATLQVRNSRAEPWGEPQDMRSNELFIIRQKQEYKMTAQDDKVIVLAHAFNEDAKVFLGESK